MAVKNTNTIFAKGEAVYLLVSSDKGVKDVSESTHLSKHAIIDLLEKVKIARIIGVDIETMTAKIETSIYRAEDILDMEILETLIEKELVFARAMLCRLPEIRSKLKMNMSDVENLDSKILDKKIEEYRKKLGILRSLRS